MDDLFVRDLERKFGDSGYAFWFKTLELMAAHGERGRLTISWVNYCEKLRKRRDHLRRMLTFATQARHVEFTEDSQDFVTITCDKFAEYSDNYTKYGRNFKATLKSVQSKEVEVEEEVEQKKSTHIAQGWFDAVWKLYPNRSGKKNALRHFLSTVRTEPDYEKIQKALKNYLASGNVKRGYIKNGSTWFNEWQDWLEPTEVMRNGNGTGGKNGRAEYRIDAQREQELRDLKASVDGLTHNKRA